MKISHVIVTFAASMLIAISAQAQWSFNGVKIFYNAGNVGVGTNNPAYKLDVRTATNARAVFGYNSAVAGTMYGVYGRSDSTAGRALFGYAIASTGTTYGVLAQSDSTAGFGVYGLANAATGTTYGVYARTNSTTGRALYGLANASTGVNYGIVAKTNSPNGFAGYFVGNVWVTGWIGTKADAPVDIYSRNHRVFRVQSAQTDFLRSANVIGGVETNSVGDGVIGATIAGGGASSDVEAVAGPNAVAASFGTIGGGITNNVNQTSGTIAGGSSNTVNGTFGFVGGGKSNIAGGDASTVAGGDTNAANMSSSTIGGGAGNIANGPSSTIGGGDTNTTGGNNSTVAGGAGNASSAENSTIGGGFSNTASGVLSTVSGGDLNVASGNYSTVGGGGFNTASGASSTIPGGSNNDAAGGSSFAAGFRAQANHQGSFVWGDSTNADINSSASNQMTFRAVGGVRIFTNTELDAGVTLAGGGNAWAAVSDRNAKENFSQVNAREVLEKLAAMPIETWNYKSQDKTIRHIGPMAQDFSAAFGVGEDELRITTIDADGVALAAIQGLHQMV